jgi:hypothetical protein
MGWSGGTQVFDSVVESIIQFTYPEDMKRKQIVSLLSTLEDLDWDNVGESAYYNHPLVKRAIEIVHPEWTKDGEE